MYTTFTGACFLCAYVCLYVPFSLCCCTYIWPSVWQFCVSPLAVASLPCSCVILFTHYLMVFIFMYGVWSQTARLQSCAFAFTLCPFFSCNEVEQGLGQEDVTFIYSVLFLLHLSPLSCLNQSISLLLGVPLPRPD